MSMLSQPSLLSPRGRVVVDADLVIDVAVELRVELGLQDVFQHAELGLFLGLERFGIVEHLAVAVAQNVGGEPAVHAQHARLEAGRQDGLHQRLAGLEILAADGRAVLCAPARAARECPRSGLARRWRRARRRDGRPGVQHRGRDGRMVVLHGLLEFGRRGVHVVRLQEDFGRAAPDHHHARDRSIPS